MRRMLLLAALVPTLGAMLPPGRPHAFVVESPARPVLRALWSTSLATRREQVACLGGRITDDTVYVTSALQLPDSASDSLTASADASLQTCASPDWIGTVHTHIRATDDDEPPARFSPGDRAVMSAWIGRWGTRGAFCVLFSEKGAHCEVYPPPRAPLPKLPG